MKDNIVIIGAGSIGSCVASKLQEMEAKVIVVADEHSPFAPEPMTIKAPPPMPDLTIYETLHEGKRNRAIRREQERKKKPKKRWR